MSLLDLFSNDASRDAYKKNLAAIQAGIGAGTGALNDAYANASRMLGTGPGSGTALGRLQGGFDLARQDALRGYGDASSALGSLGRQLNTTIGTGAGRARDALASGYGDARRTLGDAYRDTRGDLTSVARSYNPLIRAGSGAADAYYDAIGANGAGGSRDAQAAFRAGPGYQFQMDQGLDAVMRSAAARGSLAGGNTDIDLMRTGQGIADQEWDDYIANLAGGTDRYRSALDSRGAALTARANAAQNYGSAAADLAKSRGTSLAALEQNMTGLRTDAEKSVGLAGANLDAQRGTTLADLAAKGGAAAAALYGQDAGYAMTKGTNLANLQFGGMQALVNNNNALAASENAQSQNLWGGLLGLGGLALTPVTGGLGNSLGGQAYSGLTSLFR